MYHLRHCLLLNEIEVDWIFGRVKVFYLLLNRTMFRCLSGKTQFCILLCCMYVYYFLFLFGFLLVLLAFSCMPAWYGCVLCMPVWYGCVCAYLCSNLPLLWCVFGEVYKVYIQIAYECATYSKWLSVLLLKLHVAA